MLVHRSGRCLIRKERHENENENERQTDKERERERNLVRMSNTSVCPLDSPFLLSLFYILVQTLNGVSAACLNLSILMLHVSILLFQCYMSQSYYSNATCLNLSILMLLT